MLYALTSYKTLDAEDKWSKEDPRQGYIIYKGCAAATWGFTPSSARVTVVFYETYATEAITYKIW